MKMQKVKCILKHIISCDVDIERDWPRLPTLNREFLKREKVLKEKILVDVKKKVKQGERMIKTAVKNATAANISSKSTEESADALAKVGYTKVHKML